MRASLRFVWYAVWGQHDWFGKFTMIYSFGFTTYALVCIATPLLVWAPSLGLQLALVAVSAVRLVLREVRSRRAHRQEMQFLETRLDELTNVIILRRHVQPVDDDL